MRTTTSRHPIPSHFHIATVALLPGLLPRTEPTKHTRHTEYNNIVACLVMPLQPARGPAVNTSTNFLLASILALLSYVPFEWVAKGSLILSAFLFIVDPIPPLSRLLAIVSLLVVYGLTKLRNHHHHNYYPHEEAATVIVSEPGQEPSTQSNQTGHSDNPSIRDKID